MLRLSIVELFLRLIPEGILYVYAMYVLSNKRISYNNLLTIGVPLGVAIYLFRQFPIHFGVHTILFLMVYIFIAIKLMDITIIRAVSSSFIAVILLLISELINFLVLINIFHIPQETLDYIFNNDALLKNLYGIPSLVIPTVAIMIIDFIRNRIQKGGIKC